MAQWTDGQTSLNFITTKCRRTLASWFKRLEDTFQHEFSYNDGAWKPRLLLWKLCTKRHEQFTNFMLPKQVKDLNFKQTEMLLTEIFGVQ